MKRLLYLSLLFCISGYSQTVTVKHKAYTTTFDLQLKYPIKVEWWLSSKSLECKEKAKRTDDFEKDPQIPEETNLQSFYYKNGYDRGHNFPAADAQCDKQSMKESFYFSNITPQTHQLNRGDWKDLEIWTRDQSTKYDSVKVWCGCIGSQKKIGTLSVPEKCWKVIYVKSKNKYQSYLFENNAQKPDGFENNIVDISIIEKITGFKFYENPSN